MHPVMVSHRRSAVLSLVSLFFMAAGPAPQAQPVNPLVKFSAGRLTVRAVEVPLKDLLQEIGKRSGIVVELRDQKTAQKQVTLELNNVSPSLALEEILRGFSFALFHDKNGLSQVVVLSPDTSPSELALTKAPPARSPPKPVSSASKPSRSDSPPDFDELLKRNRDEGLKAIAQALKGDDSSRKLEAIDALGSFEDPAALKLLHEALGDSNTEVKKSALETLAEKEGQDVVPILSGALRDPDPSFRMEVLEALAEKGDLQAVRTALSDKSREVREKAAELLEIEDEGATKPQ
jgi:hypothetical protein